MQLTDGNVSTPYRTLRPTPNIPDYVAKYASIDNDRWKVIQWAAHVKRPESLNLDSALWFLVIEELRGMRELLQKLVDQEYLEEEVAT